MKEQGFRKFYLMVNYKSEMIRSYFGDGSGLGVSIEYFEEQTRRGTAGPLSVLKDRVKSQLVVMNSDLLTDLGFKGLLKSHKKWNADLTVALKKFNRKIAYGVVDVGEDSRVTRLREKPDLDFLINSGIYVLSPRALSLIPDEKEFKMTDLIERARENNQRVFGYIFTETWIDIGRLDDYMKTIGDLEDRGNSDTDRIFV
jgi:NDP-sugar pyrophosphorylase family protein